MSFDLVIIAASTGGPKAVRKVLSPLPENIPFALIIVQHMLPRMFMSYVKTLAGSVDFPLAKAMDGERLEKGRAYVAPAGYHLRLSRNAHNVTFALDQKTPPISGHRPAADILIGDAAFLPLHTAVIVLTGMGKDGLHGVKKLKAKLSGKCWVVAEDERSALVYGMPRAIVENHLADAVLTLDDIASWLAKQAESTG
ncbi:MAG: chemotaxis protein CheB [Candidatus Carbobacillus altaicus]|nr:chemotaxis protein CheB [Candidatus Carbobacillus altaicus]